MKSQLSFAAKLAWISENERLLEKARGKGIEIRSFDDWKQNGKYVRKGERSQSIKVQCGERRAGIHPGTGEDWYEPVFKFAYGFTAKQVA